MLGQSLPIVSVATSGQNHVLPGQSVVYTQVTPACNAANSLAIKADVMSACNAANCLAIKANMQHLLHLLQLQASPFGASIGLVHGVFALAYTPGPETKPWDELMGYPTVSGITKVKSTTFADHKGSSGCGVSGAWFGSRKNEKKSNSEDYACQVRLRAFRRGSLASWLRSIPSSVMTSSQVNCPGKVWTAGHEGVCMAC
eukprot:scaffold64824_cov20-Tisochrysis_lutea.AAC.1